MVGQSRWSDNQDCGEIEMVDESRASGMELVGESRLLGNEVGRENGMVGESRCSDDRDSGSGKSRWSRNEDG